MGRELIDITGMVFGMLTVVERYPSHGPSMWVVRCKCGKESVKDGYAMRSGKTKSCGCLLVESAGKKNRTHGRSRTKMYIAWSSMVARCNNPKCSNYHLYGGKGVRVCDRWRSFENFIADMGERPDGMTIERIDSSGDYSPDNCRWATPKEQANNTSRNVRLEWSGESRNISDWSRVLGITNSVLSWRIRKGWTVSDALTTPVRKVSRCLTS